LDLELRRVTNNTRSLDDVMRLLYTKHVGSKAQGGITEADIAKALREVSGKSFTKELTSWVHGTEDLPLMTLLAEHGAVLLPELPTTAPLAQRLGLRVTEANGIIIKTVLRGAAAELAGMAAGDEWLAVNDWRVSKLDDLALLATAGQTVTALVARDKRLLRLPLRIPEPDIQVVHSYSLRSADDPLVSQWLAPQQKAS
jgi:predicted metalloprotease with PDZ domain